MKSPAVSTFPRRTSLTIRTLESKVTPLCISDCREGGGTVLQRSGSWHCVGGEYDGSEVIHDPAQYAGIIAAVADF